MTKLGIVEYAQIEIRLVLLADEMNGFQYILVRDVKAMTSTLYGQAQTRQGTIRMR
jgi:hypothetical protein